METTKQWKGLSFSPEAGERLEEIEGALSTKEVELLHEKLAYLDTYGGPVGDDDPRRRYRVQLHTDWAPHSFSLVWERLDQTTNKYSYGWNGGLIYHGGSNDPLCVTLTPQTWGIHT